MESDHRRGSRKVSNVNFNYYEEMAGEKRPNDMEIDAIKDALKSIQAAQVLQSETMKEVLITLRGSVAMGVNGILDDHKQFKNQLIEFAKGLRDLQEWQEDIISSRGKITITIGALFTRTMATIGAIGTLVAIILGLKELMG